MSDKINLNRLDTNIKEGLSSEQVKERLEQGYYNIQLDSPSKTIKEIILSNTFTFFNLLNLSLASLVIFVKSYKNALFMGLVIINTSVGIIQEIRAKKTIDKLSLVSASSVKVIRNNKEEEIGVNDIVLDDVILFNAGNEIPVDCIVLEGEVEANESLLTGEPDGIIKVKGDILLSGSFVMSGSCYARADKVGTNSYAAKITADVKKRKKVNSELMNSLNKIIKAVAIVILPIGIALFLKERFVLNIPLQSSVISTVAALIGMIPEGLYLLTTIALAVSVVRLGKRKILVQELYCIEALARVDVICLDKTGTITEGIMEVKEIEVIDNSSTLDDINIIGSNLVNSLDDNNSTFNALKKYFKENASWNSTNKVPFSSARKWSGVTFNKYGSYVIGAPEFVLNENYNAIKDKVELHSSKGDRVLLLAKVDGNLGEDKISSNIENVALIIIKDIIRKNAKETFDFFYKQGVDIKVISGDSPVTVSEIAKQAGLINADKYIDISTLKDENEFENAILENTIFGRVKPEQKRTIVKILQSKGHTVAMTGDGVNDVLALKDCDCSIAMASGSDAARRTSQLVLTDSNFKSIPDVVLEGRRVINNIERSAALFLTKTIYTFLLSIIFIFLPFKYPFVPIQLTLLNALTIGIPSFFFTFEGNFNIVTKGFLRKVTRKASVGAITIVFDILAVLVISYKVPIGDQQVSSIIAIITGIVGLMILISVSEPFTKMRRLIVATMSVCLVVSILFLGNIFSIQRVSFYGLLIILGLMIIDYPMILILRKLMDKVLHVQ
ncbi:MAG: cation-translocating P-type ATPase [Peptostreptococcaceae bacterium]